jgi:hypothetical protein
MCGRCSTEVRFALARHRRLRLSRSCAVGQGATRPHLTWKCVFRSAWGRVAPCPVVGVLIASAAGQGSRSYVIRTEWPQPRPRRARRAATVAISARCWCESGARTPPRHQDLASAPAGMVAGRGRRLLQPTAVPRGMPSARCWCESGARTPPRHQDLASAPAGMVAGRGRRLLQPTAVPRRMPSARCWCGSSARTPLAHQDLAGAPAGAVGGPEAGVPNGPSARPPSRRTKHSPILESWMAYGPSSLPRSPSTDPTVPRQLPYPRDVGANPVPGHRPATKISPAPGQNGRRTAVPEARARKRRPAHDTRRSWNSERPIARVHFLDRRAPTPPSRDRCHIRTMLVRIRCLDTARAPRFRPARQKRTRVGVPGRPSARPPSHARSTRRSWNPELPMARVRFLDRRAPIPPSRDRCHPRDVGADPVPGHRRGTKISSAPRQKRAGEHSLGPRFHGRVVRHHDHCERSRGRTRRPTVLHVGVRGSPTSRRPKGSSQSSEVGLPLAPTATAHEQLSGWCIRRSGRAFR